MTEVWGHRGAMGYCPENTIASFDKAIEQGVDGIELDVHLSKDGYLFVCHDEKVDRTTNGTGWIKNLTYKNLKKLDAGCWFNEKFKGQRLPLLTEVFDHFKENNIKINIELKAGSAFYNGIENKVINLIEKYGYKDRIIVSSYDHRALVKIKEINSDIKTGILYLSALHKPVDYLKTVGADALHPYFLTIDKELIVESMKNNVHINTYTVNEMDKARILAKYNIHAIITNYPDKVIRTINA